MTSNLNRLLATAGLLLAAVPAIAQAQQATVISGRITSPAAAPLQGVSVSIPALNLGAYTNAEGRYSFTVPASSAGRSVSLSARRIGFQAQTVDITITGATVTHDFTLTPSAQQLEGIVVSALGIEKEKSQLGTAQQQISTEDLNVTKSMNLVQQVQGKVSGVTITGSGTPGGSTNIIIRGQNTFASNNQPLFIVDGVPVSNSNRGGGLGNGYDFGNAISDLNPEDVESMTILKGPNAAAIYGSRAQNGAVVITTKRAVAGRMRTEVTSLYTFDRPGRLPDFQNQYGQGAGGSFEYADGNNGGDCDGCDQSWGPKLDGRLICQFNSPRDASGGCTPTPWIAHPDNVKDFFKLGHTISNTVAVSGGTDRASARISVGNDNVEGFVPNNFFQKTTGLLSGQLQVTPKFSTNAVLQYVRNNGKNRPGTGYNNSIMEQFFWFGRQVDIDALRNWQQGSAVNDGIPGREYNWNYNFHNNPFFTQEANSVSDTRDRFMVQGTAKYQFLPWLSAALRSGSDIFKYNINQTFDPSFLNGSFVNQAFQGGFAFTQDYRNENNTDLVVNASHDFGSRLALNGMIAGATRHENLQTNSVQTTGISVKGTYNVGNAAIVPTLGQNSVTRDMNSVYGSLSGTLNGYWTVEATGRNDVSSTLPKGNNSYFYPSVNTSFILTDALGAIKSNTLSYLKLRGSWAEVGNDADPYQLITTFSGNPNQFGGRPQFTLGNNLLEPNLKPEITRSIEGGIEAGFFNGRASVDLTTYRKETRNQIYLVPVSNATGYANVLLNAGTMRNSGFEALLNATPLQRGNFEWQTTINYGMNNNKVVQLAGGVDRLVLGNGLFGDLRLEATQGKPYGALWGYDIRRCDANAIADDMCSAGQEGKILTDGGIPLQTDTMVYLGSIQPKWTGGINNTFSYKGLSLGALFDIRRGGKIMSYTNYVGQYSGVLKSSLMGREVDFDDPGVHVDGIDVNTKQPNGDTVTSEQYFQNLFGATGVTTYDASYVKLREIRVGYDLPMRWASRAHVQNASIALTGRNLALWTDVPNVDPEFAYSSGNFQGVEYAFPGNARTWGFSVRITP
jgi:TonB-linked SusC/RagA family outer membrane protein